jgi:hypothetical protein
MDIAKLWDKFTLFFVHSLVLAVTAALVLIATSRLPHGRVNGFNSRPPDKLTGELPEKSLQYQCLQQSPVLWGNTRVAAGLADGLLSGDLRIICIIWIIAELSRCQIVRGLCYARRP